MWLNFASRPQPKEMRKLVATRTHSSNPERQAEFLDNLHELYSNYSDYSHPGQRTMAILLEPAEDGSRLRLGGVYDRPLLLTTINLFVTSGYLISTLLAWELKNEAQAFLEEDKVIVQKVNEWRWTLAPAESTENERMPIEAASIED